MKYEFYILRRVANERRQIIENYNMGFITYYEFLCQMTDTYTWINGKRWAWHLLCLCPSWPFNAYIMVAAFLYRITH